MITLHHLCFSVFLWKKTPSRRNEGIFLCHPCVNGRFASVFRSAVRLELVLMSHSALHLIHRFWKCQGMCPQSRVGFSGREGSPRGHLEPCLLELISQARGGGGLRGSGASVPEGWRPTGSRLPGFHLLCCHLLGPGQRAGGWRGKGRLTRKSPENV